MDSAITVQSIIGVIGVIVAVGAFVGVCATFYRFICEQHDRAQKWDEYDKKIEEVSDNIELIHADMEAKLQEVRAELCMQTYCTMATLDGLHQLGCNGKVTKAREDINKYMNKQAHGVNND